MRPEPNEPNNPNPEEEFVPADVVAKRYGVTGRYILKLAAEGQIPSLRIGKKCVRFRMAEVSKAIEGESSQGG